MRSAEYRITMAARGPLPDDGRPFGIIDLGDCAADTLAAPLPSYPLIGIGDPRHRLAASLDAMIEPPVPIDAVVRTIARAPRAAAVLVDLLRGIEGIAPDRALRLESLAYGLLQGSADHAVWRDGVASTSAPAGEVRIGRSGSRLDLLLDRPQAHNAIDRPMRDRLCEAFDIATLDPDIDLVRMRGRGRAFSVGADLAEFGTTRDPATAHAIRMRTLPARALLDRRWRFEVEVQGGCVGAALEIAAFADRLVARPGAWFQLPELAMGVIPGAGGCVSVPRRIGRRRAALMILSGRRIDAATALRWGLIDEIVDPPPGDEDGADMA